MPPSGGTATKAPVTASGLSLRPAQRVLAGAGLPLYHPGKVFYRFQRTMRIPALTLVTAILLFAGCTPAARTKWNDKNMRVMVDPESLSASQYARAVDALVSYNRWTIVDRGPGLQAVKREQEMETEVGSGDFPPRFEDREKWAQWGKLWGVGAVAIGHADCYLHPSFWNFIRERRVYTRCEQFLTLIDANSAEVLASGRAIAEGDNVLEKIVLTALNRQPVIEKLDENGKPIESADTLTRAKLETDGELSKALNQIHIPEPEWIDVVAMLNRAYPSEFSTDKQHPAVVEYGDQSGARGRQILWQKQYGDAPMPSSQVKP